MKFKNIIGAKQFYDGRHKMFWLKLGVAGIVLRIEDYLQHSLGYDYIAKYFTLNIRLLMLEVVIIFPFMIFNVKRTYKK